MSGSSPYAQVSYWNPGTCEQRALEFSSKGTSTILCVACHQKTMCETGDCGCKIHRGIGGWLAFAIVLFWLLTVWFALGAWGAASHGRELFLIYTGGFFSIAFGVTAYLLTTKKKTGVQLILAVLFLEAFVYFTHLLQGSYAVTTVVYFVGSVLGMAYFARSARVKNTYYGEKIVTPCPRHARTSQEND